MLDMEYMIKTYRKEYLDDHATIETDERNRWDIIVKPNKEQVKNELTQKYSRSDFDPMMSLSAFKGNKIIGFISSSIYEEDRITKGELRIPFVAEGYEDARDALLNRMIEVLKSKGVTSIRTLVSEYWGETVSVAVRNGFYLDKNFVIQSQKRFDDIDENKLVEPKDVEPFNYRKHSGVVTKLLMKQFNVSEEEAKRVVDRFKDWKIGTKKNLSGTPQKLVAHGLIIVNEEVKGRYLGFQQEQSGDKTTDLSIYSENNNKEILGQLLAAGIIESKKSGMEILHIGLLEPTEEIKEFYSSYGLVFRTAAAYYTIE
jgi:hypothetical protein